MTYGVPKEDHGHAHGGGGGHGHGGGHAHGDAGGGHGHAHDEEAHEGSRLLPADALEASNAKLKSLVRSCILCGIFMVVEFVGGYMAHSLAVMTDGAHLLSDIVAFLVSIAAVLIARRKATSKMNWGWHRAEVLGATFSIFLIWVLTLWLIYEAISRLIAGDDHVNGKIMCIIASFGLVVNLLLYFSLDHGHSHGGGDGGHGHSHGGGGEQGMGEWAMKIHVIGDFVQTIGVLIASALIWWRPQYWYCDPICTFLFSVLVIFTTVPILKESMNVLMEGTPTNINPEAVEKALLDLGGVKVHDLHIWSVGSGKIALAVHLNTSRSGDTCDLLHAVQGVLDKKFGITHTTIQVPHTHTHTHPRTHECSRTHTHTRTHAHDTHTPTHTHTCTHTPTPTHTHARMLAHTHTHTHPHARTNARAHTHTHTRAWARARAHTRSRKKQVLVLCTW
eukprot:NODE_433_length_1700_cov_57.070260_g316_i0.p1 GENE.NODE_433_length_1700_cov_57.070260_g316_i0~~NODE_433_length_1700_cov_57.070260_g316_i0.p1  ORF type:complete len:469 (-),score=160.97 NODE_433_length_1700_cov_57.070260_g316_i0:293-1636(-)